jgi:hypothetical protein
VAGDLPELRASDADRERVADVLRNAAADGRLTVDELDERLDATFAARTRAELDTLTADVTPDGHRHADAAAAARPLPVVPGAPGATKWLISIMSGHDRRGHWRVGPKVININFWGGSDIDLNDAELTAQHTDPEGLEVTVSELSLMGGNSVKLGADRPVPGGPTVHIRLVSIMGSTEVKRGRRLTKEQRRARKLERREQPRLDR